ncbi:uncharacterized protein LOC116249323 [Nymphaea colorata]|nr:uncharacterized protein LOC116249323 [Nymphaea colorata]
MIALKVILNPSLHPPNRCFPHRRNPRPNKRNHCFVTVSCNTKDSEPSSSSPEGDERKRELLAKMAMIEAQKVRLTNFLDERSAYLTQFAEEANVEFDAIAEETLKGLDEASARIMENLESRMQAFEEDAGLNKEEIKRNDQVLQDFEDQMEKERNDGLFFKSLKTKPPTGDKKVDAKEEVKKLKEVTRGSAKSSIRRNIYLALVGLLVLTIIDALTISSAVDWRKIAVLGIILLALTVQLVYEQSISTETKEKDEE